MLPVAQLDGEDKYNVSISSEKDIKPFFLMQFANFSIFYPNLAVLRLWEVKTMLLGRDNLLYPAFFFFFYTSWPVTCSQVCSPVVF